MLHPVSRKLCASLCVSQDDLASCLSRSCSPHCDVCSENNTWSCAFSFVKLFFSFHAYRFLNELCKQCVIEDDRIGLCGVKLQSSSLSEQQHCTNFPCPEVVSKYFCKARFLLLINRKRFPLSPVHRSSDSQR